ncbi:MAG: hypothetical protein CMP96_14280, partial [Gammaproteobacteria bacterium]|nr:hypothetical protein [Gammaproteobacteria bacterium]
SWQLAVGSWQLAVGSWQLAVGSWLDSIGQPLALVTFFATAGFATAGLFVHAFGRLTTQSLSACLSLPCA